MRPLLLSIATSVSLGFLSFCGAGAEAAAYRPIYTFMGPPDGQGPWAGLIKDGEGRLYGTTFAGGSAGTGTVFRLTKMVSADGGVWTEELLHSFDVTGGSNPLSPLLLGPSGELYGTTLGGGTFGRGTVYRLDNLPGWPITLLHSFGPNPDGAYTNAGVVFGAGGLLYGSAGQASFKDAGMAFSVSPQGDAAEYAILLRFGVGPGGKAPSQLVAEAQGRLFGTAVVGGTTYGGTAFLLHQVASGAWHQETLYNFGNPNDVKNPGSPLILGRGAMRGSVIGCGEGGTHGRGAVFRLDPPAQGTGLWSETVLYNFGDQPNDPRMGQTNGCGLTQDDNGRLFGLTQDGGTSDAGAFYEIDPPPKAGKPWTEAVLYSFNTQGSRGVNPFGAPLRIGGRFYGTASGTSFKAPGFGLVWEITP